MIYKYRKIYTKVPNIVQSIPPQKVTNHNYDTVSKEHWCIEWRVSFSAQILLELPINHIPFDFLHHNFLPFTIKHIKQN